MLPYDVAKDFLKNYKATYGKLPPSIWTLMNADGMRAIIYGMEQTKSFDNKKVADFLMSMDKPLPGITGPLQFAKDGNRIGSSYMTLKFKLTTATKLSRSITMSKFQ